MPTLPLRTALATAAVVLLSAPVAASGATRTVAVRNDFFAPKTVTIAAGDTVAWAWRSGGNPHEVAGPTIRDSGIRSGGTFRLTFRRAGRHRYVCSFHEGMVGTVVVRR